MLKAKKFDKGREKIAPDIEKGIYPFKDVKLYRADVEWLLATHENGRGPVDWNGESQRERKGLDLRGADLHEIDLRNLPLARTLGGLTSFEWGQWSDEQRNMAAIHLEEANIKRAQLQGAYLRGAQLQEAYLVAAHLEEAELRKACLGRVFLYGAHLRELISEGRTWKIGIEFDHSLQSIIKNMPVVMATVTPSKRRWETRRKQIWPVVNQNSIAMVAHHLGYSLENEEVWYMNTPKFPAAYQGEGWQARQGSLKQEIAAGQFWSNHFVNSDWNFLRAVVLYFPDPNTPAVDDVDAIQHLEQINYPLLYK